MTESTTAIRIFLLDDHELVRRGLVDLLGSVPDSQGADFLKAGGDGPPSLGQWGPLT